MLALLFGIPACRTSAFSLALLSSAPPTNNYRCTASTCLFGINNEKSGVAVAVHVRDCLYGGKLDSWMMTTKDNSVS